MSENEIFPDKDWIENANQESDPLIDKIVEATIQGKIVWKKEIEIEDQYYYAVVGEPPNTFKLEFQGVAFNIDHFALVLWRKQLKPKQAHHLRYVVRRNWQTNVNKKREEFQELLGGMIIT